MTDVVVAHARPLLGPEEEDAALRVIRSGRLAQGVEVEAFEAEFAAHFRLERECVAVNSGTSGLHLALLALGIGSGDEVVVPSFTFAATANAVVMAGGTPVFADIDRADYCLDPEAVEAAITPRTRAVIPVHLYGQPARMPEIVEVAHRHGLAVIEDAAQAHGAALDGRPVGSFGDAAVFSFYPTKNMTTGEGGMVVARDADSARALRLLRNQGMEVRYRNEIAGLNNRMTDIAAAIGRVQLTKVAAWTDRRRENAAFYDRALRRVGTPSVRDGAHHVYHQYTVSVPVPRDEMAARLRDPFGVETGVFYPVPVHRLPAYSQDLVLARTEEAARTCLSLPVHPSLGPAELEHVVDAVSRVVEELR